MRTTKDRIRQTLLFEAILIGTTIPLVSSVLNQPTEKVTILSIFFSLTAMLWNYTYNIIFDKVLLKIGKNQQHRTWKLRSIHALLFEVGFAFISIPAVMIWYKYTFIQALAFDLAFLIAIPIYTFIFTLAYDFVFPVKFTEKLA